VAVIEWAANHVELQWTTGRRWIGRCLPGRTIIAAIIGHGQVYLVDDATRGFVARACLNSGLIFCARQRHHELVMAWEHGTDLLGASFVLAEILSRLRGF
jgi:hypothetical protein